MSSTNSAVSIWAIPTDENLTIALHTNNVITEQRLRTIRDSPGKVNSEVIRARLTGADDACQPRSDDF